MPSPITGADFDVQNFSGDACEALKKMLEVHNKLKEAFDWLFDGNGNPTSEFLSSLASIGVPTGSILWMPVSVVPSGYLLADGRAVSRTEYAALYSRYGTEFGAGDGSTTFNLPNIDGRFLMGKSDKYQVGEQLGSETATLTAANNGPHRHFLANPDSLNNSSTLLNASQKLVRHNHGGDIGDQDYTLVGSDTDASVGLSSESGQGTPFSILPPAQVGLWLCKT